MPAEIVVSFKKIKEMKKNIRYLIKGIVQGVGFRPFVYNCANKFQLNGSVYNDVSGVIIEIEGNEDNILNFEKYFKDNLPPRAKIHSITKKELKLKNYDSFKILKSNSKGKKNTFIPADAAICEKCKIDLNSPGNRENYPFTNCLDCGPRFSITYKIPFDRKNTKMNKFKMCRFCKEEYNNPLNRRFDSQTNCCPECGPHLILFDSNSKEIKLNTDLDKIKFIIEQIKKNKIIAIKGIGGFHLAANPFNNEVVMKLRKRKIRDDKPLALMAKDIKAIKKYAYISEKEVETIKSAEAPILILKRKKNIKISKYVCGNLDTIGFMLAYTPLHYILFKFINFPLIMTSGNISSEPIIIDNDEAREKLKNVADYFLLNDRDIFLNCDDSVINYLNNNKIIIRRSRGFVPAPFLVKKNSKFDILACGAEEKNTFSVLKNDNLILSHHIGDLENYETFLSFKKNIKKYTQIYDIKPKIIVADKHPEYLSVRYAESIKGKKYFVQHHYAHLLSLVLDNDIDYNEKIICYAWDGTGYGEDGNIWGGEIFLGNCYEYKRIGHLKYLPLVTPEKSIKEPERIFLSYMLYMLNCIPEFYKNKFDKKLFEIVKNMLFKREYILTSSMGRFFDFIAYLLGITHTHIYSGQLPVELENIAVDNTEEKYKFDLNYENDMLLIEPLILITGLINDIQKKKKKSFVAKKFHNTLAEIIFESAKLLNKKYMIKKFGFSGGVFQNQLLIKLIKEKFYNKKFELIFHKNIPPNDAGISAGQALYALVHN